MRGHDSTGEHAVGDEQIGSRLGENSPDVAGDLEGRQADEDIVLFKSNGLAAWDVAVGSVAVEKARERDVGTQV